MKFWEAMKALEEGKKIRRIEWKSNVYLELNRHGVIWDQGYAIYDTLAYDAIGCEWELYEEKINSIISTHEK